MLGLTQMVIFATSYDAKFYWLVLGWPALNWMGAVIAALAAVRMLKAVWWLVPAMIPIVSGAWLALNYVRNPDLSGDSAVVLWHTICFFSPAIMAVISSLITACRAFARNKPAA